MIMKHYCASTRSVLSAKAAWIFLFMLSCLCGLAQSTTAFREEMLYRTFQWNYGGYRFETQFSFKLSDYKFYHAKPKLAVSATFASENISHPYLRTVAETLDKDAQELGYTGVRLAEYIVAFVQQAIPYQLDPYNNGFDYPRYPIETLVDRKGDCEDKAALLAALLNLFGFDVVMLLLPGHAALAMECRSCSGTYYDYNSKKYYYIEATSSRPIGSQPEEYKSAHAKFLEVEVPSQYYIRMDVVTIIPERSKPVETPQWKPIVPREIPTMPKEKPIVDEGKRTTAVQFSWMPVIPKEPTAPKRVEPATIPFDPIHLPGQYVMPQYRLVVHVWWMWDGYGRWIRQEIIHYELY
jgi:hypothetical protein